jgi:hypothetical protein
MVTEQQIDAFSQFAKSQIESGASADSLVELLDQWLLENPPPGDLLAIEASMRDMEAGETGKPFDKFAAEFRARNGLPNSR